MSGRRDNLPLYKMVSQGDMSQATVTGPAVNILNQDNIGIQLNVTGSPVGTFTVQVSLDYAQQGQTGEVTNTGSWVTLTLGSAYAPSGSAINYFIPLSAAVSPAPWVRILYTKTSGTGNFDAFIIGKQT